MKVTVILKNQYYKMAHGRTQYFNIGEFEFETSNVDYIEIVNRGFLDESMFGVNICYKDGNITELGEYRTYENAQKARKKAMLMIAEKEYYRG